MKLSEWARQQNISTETAIRWAREGRLPVDVSRTLAGRYVVSDEGSATAPGVLLLSRKPSVESFLSEWCVLDPDYGTSKANLYDACRAWCRANNVAAPTNLARFSQLLYGADPSIRSTKPRINGKQVPVFAGVRLNAVRVNEVWHLPGTQTVACNPQAC
jgi:hypothetical protein